MSDSFLIERLKSEIHISKCSLMCDDIVLTDIIKFYQFVTKRSTIASVLRDAHPGCALTLDIPYEEISVLCIFWNFVDVIVSRLKSPVKNFVYLVSLKKLNSVAMAFLNRSAISSQLVNLTSSLVRICTTLVLHYLCVCWTLSVYLFVLTLMCHVLRFKRWCRIAWF